MKIVSNILLAVASISILYSQQEELGCMNDDIYSTLYCDDVDIYENVATSAANWLNIETGTAAIGMAGAHTSIGKGISSTPYNPANLSSMPNNELFFSKSYYLVGISHNVLGYSRRLSKSDVVGFHLFYLSSGDIEETTYLFPMGTDKFFTVQNYNFSLVYSRQIIKNLQLGTNLKYIREEIASTFMHSVAMDLGLKFNMSRIIQLGLSFNHIGPKVQFQGPGLEIFVDDDVDISGSVVKSVSQFKLPFTIRFGVATDLFGKKGILKSRSHQLTVAQDLIKSNDYKLMSSTGIEYSWRKFAFLRSGVHLNHDTALLSLGAGIHWKRFEINYAFVNYQILDATHQFGLSFAF